MEIKNNIKTYRIKNNMTQEELAKTTGITLRQIINIETYNKNCTIEKAFKLKKALQVESLDKLFYENN